MLFNYMSRILGEIKMKKLLLVLVMVLAYTFSYAEDYQPDQLGKNFDIKSVNITTEVIAPIEGSYTTAMGLNDVIVGSVRTWTNTDPDFGPSAILSISAANYSYSVTFNTTFTGDGLTIKGKWYDGSTVLTSGASFSGNQDIEFIVDEVDATKAEVGFKKVTVSASIVYTGI